MIGEHPISQHSLIKECESPRWVVACDRVASHDRVTYKSIGLFEAIEDGHGTTEGGRRRTELLDGAAGCEGVLGDAGDDELGVDLVELSQGADGARI